MQPSQYPPPDFVGFLFIGEGQINLTISFSSMDGSFGVVHAGSCFIRDFSLNHAALFFIDAIRHWPCLQHNENSIHLKIQALILVQSTNVNFNVDNVKTMTIDNVVHDVALNLKKKHRARDLSYVANRTYRIQ